MLRELEVNNRAQRYTRSPLVDPRDTLQVEKMQEIANKAQSTWDKFRRERDFHRMHHKRVVQVHPNSNIMQLSTVAVVC